MTSHEGFIPPQSREEKSKKETNSEESKIKIEEEISDQELEKHAEIAQAQIEEQKNSLHTDAKQAIESGTKSQEASPEVIATVWSEQGMDTKLVGIQGQAKSLSTDAKQKVEKVVKGSETVKDSEKEKTSEKMPAEKEQDYLDQRMVAADAAAEAKAKKTREPKKKETNLDVRYADQRTDSDHVNKQIKDYVSGTGANLETIPALENQPFNPETQKIIQERVQENLEKIFLNKETGRFNPEKHDIMTAQVDRFLDLIGQAQKEGDVNPDVSASQILSLVQENVGLMAFQDRIASENTLGDHGIRHVVDYNIRITEQILDSLADKGQEVRAIDRIMGHQAMLMHDLGYATDPVREGVNKGDFEADKGHNLLSAKILRQRSEYPNDPLPQVFSREQLALIHEGVLEHDSSEVKFHLDDNRPDARKDNLLSAIHLADNTHAFEDKLPELLYTVPESLQAMRMLSFAKETDDSEMFEAIKNQLVGSIGGNKDFSLDDKVALITAVKSLTAL